MIGNGRSCTRWAKDATSLALGLLAACGARTSGDPPASIDGHRDIAPAAPSGTGPDSPGGGGIGGTGSGGSAAGTGSAGELGGAGGGEIVLGPGDFATFCTGAKWTLPDRSVAAAFSGNDLVLVAADGSRRVADTFDASIGATAGTPHESLVVSGDRITASIAAGSIGTSSLNGETVRLDKSGKVIWRLPGVSEVASDAGMAASIDGERRLIRADGSSSPLPVAGWDQFSFLTALDTGGWMIATWSIFTDGGPLWHAGFVNLDGQRVMEVPIPPGNPLIDVGPVPDPLVYLLRSDAGWAVSVATPDGAHAVPIDVPLGTDPPIWLLRSARWGLVTTIYGTPLRLFDRSTEAVAQLDSNAVAAAIGKNDYMPNPLSAGDWFLGAQGYAGAPVWLLHAPTAQIERVALDRLLPLRPTDHDCGSDTSVVLDDGRVGTGLRDDRAAGFYLGRADGTDWTRIGRPFRDVGSISARHVADTWILTGNSGKDSYCGGFSPFAAAEPGDDAAIVGDAVQIAAPGAEPLVFTASSPFQIVGVTLDPTGMCALGVAAGGVAPAKVYDLAGGTAVDFAGITSFTWL